MRRLTTSQAKPRPLPHLGEVRSYPVLLLRDIVVFPHMIVPLFVGREKSIRALDEAMRSDVYILLATQKNASDDDPATDSIYDVGTLASVLQLLKLPDGTVKVLVEGAVRARVLKHGDRTDYYEAEAVVLADEMGERVEAEAMARSVVNEFGAQTETSALARSTASQFKIYVNLANRSVTPEVVAAVGELDDPDRIADTIAANLAVSLLEKQRILELSSVRRRLETCLSLMEREIMALPAEKRQRRTQSPALVRQDRREGDFVEAATTDIEATWKRIVNWLEKHAPRAAASLQRGASEDELREFEAAIGQRMPADWRALYRLANGQADVEQGIWFGLPFADLESSLTEWRGWKNIVASHDDEDLREKYMDHAGSYPDGAVRLTYACTGWIPLAHDYSSNHFGVDLSPGDAGTHGQIINFGRDETLKFVMARSLGLFLQWMADEMERGGAAVDEHGSPILGEWQHFLDAVPKRFGPLK